TAEIAVQAALTGHLVFSTLHTNDAPSSVTRLLDMGVEDYLVTSTVAGIVAQRLVRTLCAHCREPYPALPELASELRLERFTEHRPPVLFKAVGCEHCDGLGYRGRTTIIELLVMNDDIRRAVMSSGDAVSIREAARAAGTASMLDDGLDKALRGITTIEEVERATQDA
ncbi:MAG: Flp pilus assembly complex ATPase component TadA, partial [Gammaproteobacteria bacterium]|nr:Flp pilus assembly complex ATPase component TadA [Gammaproteobacteria bacterium]